MKFGSLPVGAMFKTNTFLHGNDECIFVKCFVEDEQIGDLNVMCVYSPHKGGGRLFRCFELSQMSDGDEVEIVPPEEVP